MKVVQSPQQILLMRKAELLAYRQCLQQLIMFTMQVLLGHRCCLAPLDAEVGFVVWL